MATPADPDSLHQRGLRHSAEAHPAPFRACLACWPGAVLCGRCGHATAGGDHGALAVREGATVLIEGSPCRVRDGMLGDAGEACGCRRGAPLREVVIEPVMLPGSPGRPTPRPFPQPSAAGWRRGLRGRRL